MANWLYLLQNTNGYKRSAAPGGTLTLNVTRIIMLFRNTSVLSIYLSSFNINTKKTLGDTCVSSLSTVWKEGRSDKVPGKKGILGKISRLQQPRLSPSEGLDFFPFGFKLITFLSRLTRWKSGKEIRHQGVEPGKGQEWQSGEIYSVLDFQKKLRQIFWWYQSTFAWVYLLSLILMIYKNLNFLTACEVYGL